jgi:hypothetical protein
MGQNTSSFNENINNIIININNRYNSFININFIDILIELYSEKLEKFDSKLLDEYSEIIFNKKFNKKDLSNYIKNKLILLYKLNKSLANCDEKLKVIYGSTWNSKISSCYKCHVGSLYHILKELQNNNNIITNKDLKSFDENYQILILKIDEMNKSLFIEKLKITKKEKNILLSI